MFPLRESLLKTNFYNKARSLPLLLTIYVWVCATSGKRKPSQAIVLIKVECMHPIPEAGKIY